MKKFCLLFFSLLIFSAVYSQSTSEIYDLAKTAFEAKKYEETYRRIVLLNNRINELSQKKQNDVRYMETKTGVYLFVNKADTMVTNRLGKHTALHLFEMCMKENSGKKMIPEKGFNDEIRSLYPFLYENAKMVQEEQLLNFSELYFDACKKSDESNEMNQELEAGIYLINGDTITATRVINLALDEFRDSEKPNALKALIGIYLIQSRIYLDQNKALKSYDATKSALAALEKYKTIMGEKADKKYIAQTRTKIQCMELESLAAIPTRVDEAIKKFEEALNEEPKNYSLLIGFGQVLSNVNLEKAAEIYNRAIEVEPKNYIGYFNLGALYLNEGIKYFNQIENKENNEKYRQAFFTYQELYGQSYVWMENALKLSPENLNVLYALRRLAAGLYYPDDVRKYNMLIEKVEYKRKVKINQY